MNDNWKKGYSRYKELFLNTIHLYYSKPNIKVYLELILSITTIICFSLFAIKPTILTIIQLNKEIKSKEETLAKINQKISNLTKAEIVLQDEGVRLALLNQAIPDTASLDTLLSRNENIVNATSVDLTNISIPEIQLSGKNDSKRKPRSLQEDIKDMPQNSKGLPFIISLNGNYQNLYNFIKDMENSLRPVRTDQITFNSTKIEDVQTIRLTFTGRVPFFEKIKL